MVEGNVREATNRITRRLFLFTGTAAAAEIELRVQHGSSLVEAKEKPSKEVKIVQFSDSGQREAIVMVRMIVKTDADWMEQLTPEEFNITRRAGTEYPYAGRYRNLRDKGLYRCICCDAARFDSDTKYDSGTGWPSFWQPITKENIRESVDYTMGMMRTAISCRRCDAHIGHVFGDPRSWSGACAFSRTSTLWMRTSIDCVARSTVRGTSP
jgi:peptide-methionine (R)-S-oxide reductase